MIKISLLNAENVKESEAQTLCLKGLVICSLKASSLFLDQIRSNVVRECWQRNTVNGWRRFYHERRQDIRIIFHQIWQSTVKKIIVLENYFLNNRL